MATFSIRIRYQCNDNCYYIIRLQTVIHSNTGVCKINARSENTRFESQPPAPQDQCWRRKTSSGSACKINARLCSTASALSFQLWTSGGRGRSWRYDATYISGVHFANTCSSENHLWRRPPWRKDRLGISRMRLLPFYVYNVCIYIYIYIYSSTNRFEILRRMYGFIMILYESFWDASINVWFDNICVFGYSNLGPLTGHV